MALGRAPIGVCREPNAIESLAALFALAFADGVEREVDASGELFVLAFASRICALGTLRIAPATVGDGWDFFAPALLSRSASTRSLPTRSSTSPLS